MSDSKGQANLSSTQLESGVLTILTTCKDPHSLAKALFNLLGWLKKKYQLGDLQKKPLDELQRLCGTLPNVCLRQRQVAHSASCAGLDEGAAGEKYQGMLSFVYCNSSCSCP